ncbi:hypothetical protein ASG92_20520 [Arthrobacter sp. Soil736]|uniref:DUF6668 family protein n=1 Tax=Arthrobacter sp. Soil736 TaxID=1736395 RepID=UPI0006FDD845|nr:DUF6668 family protein [Arthrobacter sp. Soil736]KRE61774.1 hypothetical protein ASG92_20520 [Arthrobacter sp. Soil736]
MMTTGQESKWIQAVNGDPEASVSAPVAVARLPLGPARPQKGIGPMAGAGHLGRRKIDGSPGGLWVLGTHGGAGEATIASMLDGSMRASHAWPVREDLPLLEGKDSALLVCRSNAKGLRSAQSAAIEWASGALDPLALAGLVIVSDAPSKLPKDLQDLIITVSGAVPHMWRMPWVEDWRRGLSPVLPDLPRQVRNVVADIQLHTAAHTPSQ